MKPRRNPAKSSPPARALGGFVLAMSLAIVVAVRADTAPAVVADTGGALDVSAWRFRKPVTLARGGVQQLEFDLDVLAHAQPDFRDVRLVRDGKQVGWLRDPSPPRAPLVPAITVTNDSRDPKISRWVIRLSHAALPVSQLECATRTPLFQRELTLYEEAVDPRGETHRRVVGQGPWTRTPNRRAADFVMTVNGPLQTDTLFLETQNGDNPPLELEQFRVSCPTARVLFTAGPGDKLFLYYGNADAVMPRYDLNLVANQVFSADKTAASLGAEEEVRKLSWRERGAPGRGGAIFWGILAVVVVVLLALIARLLPKPQSKN